MPSAVAVALDALFEVLVQLHDGEQTTLVCQGDPGNYQPDLIVAVLGAAVPIGLPTMRGGTKRSRDKVVAVQVMYSAYAAGGPEAQPVANDVAWTAADKLDDYFRFAANDPLAPGVYNAFVLEQIFTPETAWEDVDGTGSPVAAGRVAIVTNTVQISIRPS